MIDDLESCCLMYIKDGGKDNDADAVDEDADLQSMWDRLSNMSLL